MSKLSINIIVLTILMGIAGSITFGHGIYMRVKADFAQYLLLQAWNESKRLGKPVKPWPWADTRALAKLEFPRQNKSFIIMEGSSGRTLAFAPGHLTGSTLPGDKGHTIISAHRDTHFSVLEDLIANDILTVETIDNRLIIYKVIGSDIVDSSQQSLILQPEAGLMSLITCYPFNALEAGGPLRFRLDAVRKSTI